MQLHRHSVPNAFYTAANSNSQKIPHPAWPERRVILPFGCSWRNCKYCINDENANIQISPHQLCHWLFMSWAMLQKYLKSKPLCIHWSAWKVTFEYPFALLFLYDMPIFPFDGPGLCKLSHCALVLWLAVQAKFVVTQISTPSFLADDSAELWWDCGTNPAHKFNSYVIIVTK